VSDLGVLRRTTHRGVVCYSMHAMVSRVIRKGLKGVRFAAALDTAVRAVTAECAQWVSTDVPKGEGVPPPPHTHTHARTHAHTHKRGRTRVCGPFISSDMRTHLQAR
jgi:Leu/Phe-tRNA-protein transferase